MGLHTANVIQETSPSDLMHVPNTQSVVLQSNGVHTRKGSKNLILWGGSKEKALHMKLDNISANQSSFSNYVYV